MPVYDFLAWIMMKSLKTLMKATAASLVVFGTSLLSATSANATYNSLFWDVEADAGSFGPVVLGESISLDACGSRLFVVQFPTFGASLCNITNISLFSVNWFAKNIDTGDFEWLTGGLGTNQNPNLNSIPTGTAAANLQTTVNTGSGTFFSSVGTYAIGVYVAGTNNVTFTETTSNGTTSFVDTANFGPDFASSLTQAFSDNGSLNNGADWGANFAVTAPPVSVPEPMQLLILLPALLLIARRERKRTA